jgi:hypothetical protein
LLLGEGEDKRGDFPINGIVALETEDQGVTWKEIWRVAATR